MFRTTLSLKYRFSFKGKQKKKIFDYIYTARILENVGTFLNLNKMKTKNFQNHMSQYFIHNRT